MCGSGGASPDRDEGVSNVLHGTGTSHDVGLEAFEHQIGEVRRDLGNPRRGRELLGVDLPAAEHEVHRRTPVEHVGEEGDRPLADLFGRDGPGCPMRSFTVLMDSSAQIDDEGLPGSESISTLIGFMSAWA